MKSRTSTENLSMATYYDTKKSNYGAWMKNFDTVAAANAVALGLSAGDLTEISNAATNFDVAFANQEAMRDAAKGATALCDQEWSDAMAVASKFNAKFQAIPGISPELLAQLGLNVPSGSGTVPVYDPIDLSAFGASNGVNTLRWKRNGNESGTVFVIETSYGSSNTWQIVDTTTRTKFEHIDQVPGVFVRYRVYARRGTTSSNPSNTASVYDPEQMLSVVQNQAA